MGMGMKSLKWEGIGTKNLFPHTSSLDSTPPFSHCVASREAATAARQGLQGACDSGHQLTVSIVER